MGKSTPRNPFYFFFTELRQNSGKNMSNQQAAELAGPLWAKMNAEQKLPYQAMAQKFKGHQKKLTSAGETYESVRQENQAKEQQERQAKAQTENIVKLALTNGDLGDQYFYVIHLNYFCLHQAENKYYPAEVALGKFNLRHGILSKNVLHSLIYPGRFPTGYAFSVKQKAEESHRLPCDHGDKYNIDEVLISLITYLPDTSEDGVPPVFVLEEDLPAVRQMLTDMCIDIGQEPIFKVYSLNYLLYVLKNTVHSGEDKAWPAVSLGTLELQKDPYAACDEIACDYHQAIDGQLHCSKAKVIRWCYVICDNCTPQLGFPLIPDQHVPIKAYIKPATSTATTGQSSSHTATSSRVSVTLTTSKGTRGRSTSSTLVSKPLKNFEAPTETSTVYETDTTPYHGFESSDSQAEEDDTPTEMPGATQRLRKPYSAAVSLESASQVQTQSQQYGSLPMSQSSVESGYIPARRPFTAFYKMNKQTGLKPPEQFDFPFTPYQIQHEFMKTLYDVIENKKLGIFESPTGTGKSLSIICAAIRWLKDHNLRDREVISQGILELEIEKQKLDSDSNWFTAQSKGIEVNRKLSALKIEQNKINEYDKKIENLKSKKEQANNMKKYCSQSIKKTIEKKAELSKSINETNELDMDEGDILLEEMVSKDESSGEEEEEGNKYNSIKVFICSRTHSQLSQFVGEIIKSPFGENVRVTSLGSRQNYCVNPNINKLKNLTLINEKCLDMQRSQKKSVKTDKEGKITKRSKTSGGKCEFYKQSNIQDLKDISLLEVLDIEDLVSSGKQLKACPYYASRKAAEDAEIILVPYNTILHKATREANGIKLKNNVIIVDEAHNLLEAMVQMYSAEVNYLQLYHCEKQLKNYKTKYSTRFSSVNLLRINQMIFVTTRLKQLLEKIESKNLDKSDIFTVSNFVLKAEIDNYNMFQLVKFCKDSRLAQKLRGFVITHPQTEATEEPKKGIKQFLSSIENKKDSKSKPSEQERTLKTDLENYPVPSNPLLSLISFMEALTYTYDDGRIVTHNMVDTKERKLQFLVLNPTEHFKDIVKDARTVIVAGGTMKPIEEFRDRLFKTAGANIERIVEFSCDHIIPKENILPIILTTGSKKEKLRFNYENRYSMGNCLKTILSQACKKIKGGIVVFFPSYKYENWIWQQLEDFSFNRVVFREPQQSSGVDAVLENYAKAINKPNSNGALLLSVVGGKLSEGLNFSDDLGRCVIVVGMPYANIYAVDLKEKMAYLDKTEGTGSGQRFYENMCMKAVNQCIGRAVRHKNDFATVILLDERYDRSGIKISLPGWIKRSLITADFEHCFNEIEKFLEEKTLTA